MREVVNGATLLQTRKVTPSIAPHCKWFVMDNLGSDHLPCVTHVRRQADKPAQKTPRVFVYDTKSNNPVANLRKKTRPPPAKKRRATQPPWWNEEIDNLWVVKRKALKEHQKAPTNEALREAAKAASNRFKEAAIKSKSDRYETFCKEVTADKALIKFWNLFGAMQNKRKARTIPDFTDDNGVWLHTDSEKGMAFFERFVKQTDQKNEEERAMYVSRIRAYYEEDTSTVEVQPHIVKHHIKCSGDSAPGPDGVRYSHMKTLSEKEVIELTAVLQKSIDEGEVPEDWLHSHLTPVPKPEKDPTKISSYRIITMQNAVGKLLEKIVARKLSIELEEKNHLPITLGSYIQGKDTWANAAVPVTDVYDSFER